MTNHEKIKYLLDMNVYEGVKCYSQSSDKWTFYTTEHLQLSELTLKDYVNNEVTSITPIIKKPNLLPIGTKVRVASEWSNEENYTTDILDFDISTYTYFIKFSGFTVKVPSRAVIPLLDTNE